MFPYIRPKDVRESVTLECTIGLSETGWMKSDIFYGYIRNGFNQWLVKNNIKKPVLVFVDGHKSHMTLEVSKFCSDNEIILYALPPNTTHIMHSLGFLIFKLI